MSDIAGTKRPLFSTYEAILFRDSVINKWHPWTDV